jgi:hypothetical protein
MVQLNYGGTGGGAMLKDQPALVARMHDAGVSAVEIAAACNAPAALTERIELLRIA